MFRDIRKKKNQISTEAAEQLLIQARRGVLAVNGREGYPYAIPINYYYDREAQKIYFHGARAGHKAEAIRACDKVCFTVYGGETIREEAWAPYLRSVVVFGRCRLLEQSPETEVVPARPGDTYPLGEGVTLTILGPVAEYDDLNLTSEVCRVDEIGRAHV